MDNGAPCKPTIPATGKGNARKPDMQAAATARWGVERASPMPRGPAPSYSRFGGFEVILSERKSSAAA